MALFLAKQTKYIYLPFVIICSEERRKNWELKILGKALASTPKKLENFWSLIQKSCILLSGIK